MSTNEDIRDNIVRHGVDLLRLEGRERRQVLALLRKLEMDLVAAIGSVDPTSPVQQTYRTARLSSLLEQARETIRSAYRDANQMMAGELIEVADVEGAFARRAVDRAVGVAVMDAALTRGQLRAIASDVLIQGAPTREWWSRQAGDTLERFADEMRRGFAAGEGVSDLVRRVRGQATGARSTYWQGPKGELSAFPVQGWQKRQFVEFSGGLMDTSTRNAETLVRSSVQAVANEARLETWRENDDIVKGVVVVATLDSRTSEICMARSGLEYTLDGEPIGHDIAWDGGPPWHHNCRSTTTPILASADEVFGRRVGEIPESTRASMDGQVPESTTFDAFLRRKPQAFQDDMLGAGKAELWREGKIGLRDLLDQRGRPLTLEELRARV